MFIVRFCYEKENAFSIVKYTTLFVLSKNIFNVSDEGQPIVSLQYKDEKIFRSQTKHIIKKINSVTKKLDELNVGVVPELKLTYVKGIF